MYARRNLALLALVAAALAAPALALDESERLDRVNGGFLAHLDGLTAVDALAITRVRESWTDHYRDAEPAAFVPDALTVLYPDFAAALATFDRGADAAAATAFAALAKQADPYLAASSLYYEARALAAQGKLEEVEALVAPVQPEDFADHTPLAPQLGLIRAWAAAADLRFDAARGVLDELAERFPAPPEPVQVGARELGLRLQRRADGSLDQVAELMGFAARRLGVDDAGQRVQDRQQKAVDLLAKLIKQAEEREQQQQQQGQGQGNGNGRGGRQAGRRPSGPAAQSTERNGAGDPGEQHAAPTARPGDMWGRLPPAQREQILQSLRERYPSRYRQLVEQYYRALSEER